MRLRSLPTFYPVLACLLAACLMLSGCASAVPILTPEVTAPRPSPTPNPEQRQTQEAWGATPTSRPSPTPWPIASPTEPQAFMLASSVDLNPLTGLPAESPNLLQQRPVLVKLANWPRELRPAVGLNAADMVFEYYIGFQMNHYAALYYGGDAAVVGPLAPGRLLDARLAAHYQANFVYASAEPTIEGVLKSVLPDREFSRGFLGCPAICTETEARGGNTMVNTAAVREHAASFEPTDFTPALGGLSFSKEISTWDEQALRLSYLYADFSVMDWRYDPTSQQYQLWQDAQTADGSITLQQTFDRDSEEPVAFENVLILFANYIEYESDLHDIDMREGDPNQQAFLLRDGKLIFGTWGSSGPEQPFQFRDLNGHPLALKPGRSWVVFASTNTHTSQTTPGNWDLTFSVR